MFLQDGEDPTAAGQAICDEAESIGAAAIVVASHCHQGVGEGLAEWIRGSTAEYLVRHSPRSVMVIDSFPGML
jgi:nucleotide-binding universal stress UspA family protein